MMSQSSSRSLIIAAWLMLLTFVCVAVAPSVALAKKDMTIATEGDPTDGLDYSGGGGSGVQDLSGDGESKSSRIQLDFEIGILPTENFYILPVWENGKFVFVFYVKNNPMNLLGAIK